MSSIPHKVLISSQVLLTPTYQIRLGYYYLVCQSDAALVSIARSLREGLRSWPAKRSACCSWSSLRSRRTDVKLRYALIQYPCRPWDK